MKFLGLPLTLWGSLCLVLTIIWVFVWPRHRAVAGWRFMIVRWFHALTWLLLALAAFVAGYNVLGGVSAAKPIALASLVVYLVFMGALATSKPAR